jgi:hypothetical protein
MVNGIQIVRDNAGGFSIRVTLYRAAVSKIANRVAKCVQREKRRHYYLIEYHIRTRCSIWHQMSIYNSNSRQARSDRHSNRAQRYGAWIANRNVGEPLNIDRRSSCNRQCCSLL